MHTKIRLGFEPDFFILFYQIRGQGKFCPLAIPPAQLLFAPFRLDAPRKKSYTFSTTPSQTVEWGIFARLNFYLLLFWWLI